MPRYLFTWSAVQSNVRISIELHAPDEREAGVLAAYALKDLSKGHGRVWEWRPQVGVSKDTRV